MLLALRVLSLQELLAHKSMHAKIATQADNDEQDDEQPESGFGGVHSWAKSMSAKRHTARALNNANGAEAEVEPLKQELSLKAKSQSFTAKGLVSMNELGPLLPKAW